jgi:hypothetical protein
VFHRQPPYGVLGLPVHKLILASTAVYLRTLAPAATTAGTCWNRHRPDEGPGRCWRRWTRDEVPPPGLPRAHVGVAAGPVVAQGGDSFGRTVNPAAHRRRTPAPARCWSAKVRSSRRHADVLQLSSGGGGLIRPSRRDV